ATPIENLKLSGFEVIKEKGKFEGGLRLSGREGVISGLRLEQFGKGGSLKPVAKIKKGTKEGIYRVEIIQELRENLPKQADGSSPKQASASSTIIRRHLLQFNVIPCPQPNTPPCEANPTTQRLLQHVYGKHSPIYPREGEPTTYTASARGKVADGIGITNLSIDVEQYSLNFINLGGTRVLIPFLAGTFNNSQAFPNAPLDAEITLDAGPYPRNTLVVYTATATFADGSSLRDAQIYHAANLNDEAINFYRGAVPVYVRGSHADKMDFLFIPDIDYGNDETAYITDLEDQLFNRMFTDPPYRWKRFRRYMNVYMNMLQDPYKGDAEGLSAPNFLPDKPDNYDGAGQDDLPWVDVAVTLHQNPFQDWAFLGLMSGNFCTAEASTDVINMEALHALMFLKDEYPGNFSQPPIEHPNVFNSKADCEAHLATHPGFYATRCEQGPGQSNYWHWCHSYMTSIGETIHVMDIAGQGPFAVEERCQLAWAVDNLLGSPQGSAYGPLWVYGCPGFPCEAKPSAQTDPAQLAEEDVTGLPYPERELMLQEVQPESLSLFIRLQGKRASLLEARVQRGPAQNLGGAVFYKGREQGAPFRLQLLKGSTVIKEIGLNDPRLVGEQGDEHGVLKNVDWSIRLPFKELSKANRLKLIDHDQRVVLDAKFKAAR
ncbi:MAG TPA: hypothetical protein VID27_18185, partial [Blastocatellia bacterium]